MKNESRPSSLQNDRSGHCKSDSQQSPMPPPPRYRALKHDLRSVQANFVILFSRNYSNKMFRTLCIIYPDCTCYFARRRRRVQSRERRGRGKRYISAWYVVASSQNVLDCLSAQDMEKRKPQAFPKTRLSCCPTTAIRLLRAVVSAAIKFYCFFLARRFSLLFLESFYMQRKVSRTTIQKKNLVTQ